MKANFHTSLDKQKQSITKLQSDIESAKTVYAKALSNLEAISEEIHQKRQSRANSVKLGKREAGVGSESPVPSPYDEKSVTKANNNNGEPEAEIIISFPPAATTESQDLSTADTITTNGPEPIDISGIQISVTSGANDSPVIVINSATDNSSSSNQQSDPVKLNNNKSQSNLANENQHFEDTVSSEQQPNGHATILDAPDTSETNSAMTSPVVLRHKRVLSGSIKLSAKRLLHETSSVESDSGSVNSFVALDDAGVVSALAEEYFTNQSYEEELKRSTHEDYSKLPKSLAHYQRPYETTRNSFSPLEEADLKLEQVLKLLDNANDESIV